MSRRAPKLTGFEATSGPMVLMNDFTAESQELRDDTLAAVARVIDSGWYVLGSEVEAFEREWAAACDIRYAVGMGNGMDALEVALRSLDIGEGDEVVTTSMTAFATVLAILRAGATPVLADVNADTALLSIHSAERCLTPRTKAIVLVHLYGQLRDMAAWQALCTRHGIALIEDCAQSHVARLNGKTAGSFGSAGAYSFYPTKNLGALGDAGALVTNDQLVRERAARLRNYGQSVRYEHPELGLNSRLDEVQAAILRTRLKHLCLWTARRQHIASLYYRDLSNPSVTVMAQPQEPEAHVFHLFVVLCTNRSALQEHLQKQGVQSLIHYPVPVHHQVPCRSVRRDPEGLSASECHGATCVSLPVHPQLSDTDVQRVIDAVNTFAMP